jgi:hypothetical protein
VLLIPLLVAAGLGYLIKGIGGAAIAGLLYLPCMFGK